MKYFLFTLYIVSALVGVHLFVGSDLGTTANAFLLFAVFLGIYMAVNIGANDVANSVGPAVGSGALTLKQAIIIAAIFELAGAVIAGGEVVKTIKDGIIDISQIGDYTIFMFIMLSALFSAALWLNFATYFKAPVSTTHSIVGGVMGAGIAAMGIGIVSWETMGKIVSSWFISPILGGIVAALFLFFIKHLILHKKDKIVQAKKWVPFFVSIMIWAFTTYIILKGLKNIVKLDFIEASHIGLILGFITYFSFRAYLSKISSRLSNDRKSMARLFNIPLIFSVILLTFAHGSNDVANAIGPLAAIYDSLINSSISGSVGIPFWIMLLGGTGLSFGLLLFGPKLIKAVGGEITELDQVRAFCIALSAALTVILASQLGLPVSSTHIAIGGVFGVGFLREYLHKREHKKKECFVERSMLKKIVAAWLITVPVVAFLSGALFFIFNLLFI
ncbi:MAG: inorganic phosphate transporter [Candidatus Gracilibacteria bacterium]|nr:inorganic phosphate transporter [Candidatus Gracilibacteria bacterium]